MNKWVYRISLFVVLVLLSGCALLPKEEEVLRPPLLEPAQMRVKTSEVQRQDLIKAIEGTAVVESVSSANHFFTQSGFRLEELLVRAGDHVEKGQLLANLSVPGIEMELLSKQIELERKTIALNESGDGDRRKLALMEQELAAMALSETQKKYNGRQLRAQISGVITFVEAIKAGDWVEAYKTLVVIADPNQMQLSYQVIDTQAAAEVEVGMQAEVTAHGVTWSGRVVQTPRSAPYTSDERLRDKYARSLIIDAEDLPAGTLLGSAVNVKIELAKRENVITIPKAALRELFSRTFVQVLEGDLRKEIDVQVGIRTATMIEIINGLTEGQLVIEP